MRAAKWVASVVMGASLAGAAFAASAQEQVIPSMVYRTGPYAPNGTYVLRRNGNEIFICIFNLTAVPRPGYRVGAPVEGEWRALLNSDNCEFGGRG